MRSRGRFFKLMLEARKIALENIEPRVRCSTPNQPYEDIRGLKLDHSN